MSMPRFPTLFAALIVSLLPTASAVAQRSRSGDDRVGVGRDITVAEGESVADIACIFCKVRLHGDARGDVAILFGSVVVDPGRAIGGDVALLGGNVTLGEGASIGGDAAILGGAMREARGATVHGDRVVLPGLLWILLLPLAPLLLLAGLVWLVVWVVRRNRYPRPPMRRF